MKITLSGSTSVGTPFASRVKPPGAFIQAFAEMIEMVPISAMNGMGSPSQKCVQGRSRSPAVDVDGDEDGLEEERDALHGEGDAEDVAEPAGQARPEQAHLEREDRAGGGAHREQQAAACDQRRASRSAASSWRRRPL